MSISGFDWLNIASNNSSDSNSPAPPVSFGYDSTDDNKDGQTVVKVNEVPSNQVEDTVKNEVIKSQKSAETVKNEEEDDKDDSSIPLSLTAQELTLEESKTYMRWYSDILARTNSRTVTINDVFSFLHNFRISDEVKEKLTKLFSKILYSINIGEFFALLRLIAHALNGLPPKRKYIRIKLKIPTPPSILSKKRQNDDDESQLADDTEENESNNEGKNGESKPLDIDSFTQFMLTGKRPDETAHRKKRSKNSKSVKFSDQIVTDVHDPVHEISPSPQPGEIDYSLPMNQLMQRLNNSQTSNQNQKANDEEEQEILKDMESQMNHFQNLHSVDTASIGGVPAALDVSNGEAHLLRPNVTGPSDMARIFSPLSQEEASNQAGLLRPNMTGPIQASRLYSQKMFSDDGLQYNGNVIDPSVSDPADMARRFSPSPMGDTFQNNSSILSQLNQDSDRSYLNSTQNSKSTVAGSPLHALSSSERRLPPPPVPSRRARSVSSPTPRNRINEKQMPPTSEGWPQAKASRPLSPLSSFYDSHSNSEANLNRPVPPVPPPSRRRIHSSSVSNTPPPLPPKIPTQGDLSHSDIYTGNNDSTANILDDLKALQKEVDKIRDMTGGF